MANAEGKPVRLDLNKTPYIRRIQDACDMLEVMLVGVKGPARWAKTIAAENKVGKHWDKGPHVNVLWLMQTKDDLSDYIDERVTWMLENHPGISEKIDWSDSRNGRFRMEVAKSITFWRAATMKALRGKSAPIIVADEIDAYEKRVRRALKTLIKNRQREHGTNALFYACSHPDAGPTEGIDDLIRDGLIHLWFACCPQCGESSSPAKEAEALNRRYSWNVTQLLERSEEIERTEMLEIIKDQARLICPHCGYPIPEQERFQFMAEGDWLHEGQTMDRVGVIHGAARVHATMGFVGHAMMSPFVNLGELAAAWAAAWLTFKDTAMDDLLREETVKSLGETYGTPKTEEQIDDWKVVKARLAAGYLEKTVPPGVLFLTAFVDVQGNRFEVRVIGWNLAKQSWLIDAFAIKQWPGFDNIDPSNRLGDWSIIEQAVLQASYPLASTMSPGKDNSLLITSETKFLSIARTAINNSGSPGVTNNGRVWLSNMLARQALGVGPVIEPYRVLLFQGSPHKKGETYGRPQQKMVDDAGKALAVPVYERVPVVHDIKRMIALRLKIEEGPGRMHLPFRINDHYIRELVSERMVNGDWVPSGRNETWDGWVACELARATLQPDRPGLWDTLPDWATPRKRTENAPGEAPPSWYDRLAKYNRGIFEEE